MDAKFEQMDQRFNRLEKKWDGFIEQVVTDVKTLKTVTDLHTKQDMIIETLSFCSIEHETEIHYLKNAVFT